MRLPLPSSNRNAAAEEFERARQRGLGVDLRVLCQLGPLLACYVWAPRDATEMEYSLMAEDGLKFSLPTPLDVGRAVENRLLWTLRRLRMQLEGERPFINYPPSKTTPTR